MDAGACRRLWIAVAALIAAIAPWAAAQPEGADGLPARLAALEERLEAARVENHIAGMSLVIVLNDEIVLARGFGLCDIERGVPADAATKYAIGSSTKAFTSLLVAMMVDDGKMTWDEPVRTHAPFFHLSDAQADAEVTIRDLLGHRSGLGRTDLLWYGGGATREQVFAALAVAELASPFRSAFNYNNIGFLTAGLAAADAAGSDWESMIRARILEPLGMNASDLSIEEMAADPNASKGYMWDQDKGEFTPVPMRSIARCAPAGAINSTVLDMARWVRLQLGRGAFEGRRLVSAEALGETWTSQIDIGAGASYGMGWMLHEWNGTRVVEHGGNIDGFAAQVAMLPDRNAGFVLLTNASFTPLTATAQGMVWEALFPPVVDPSAAMTEAQMQPFTGKFRFDAMGIDVTILVKEGKLHCDVPGQTVYELRWPDVAGKWAFALTDAIKVAFEKTPDGSVPSITMFQAGMEYRMPRVNADGTVVKAPVEPSPFTPEQLRDFAGTYHFAQANQDWRVAVTDGLLTIDVPGQMVYALKWPDAGGKWAFALTEGIKVSFERDADGAVNQLTCYQAGAVLPLPRTAPGDDAGLPTVDQLMDLRAARVDPDATRALGTIRARCTMRFVQQGIDATVTSLTDQQDRFNSTIDMGVFGSIRMASDGTTAWNESLGRPVEAVTGERAAALRREATTMFIKDLRQEFATVEVVRKDQVDGTPVIVVRARSADGERTVTEYIDAATGLPLREESATVVPGLGPIPTTSTFADYRDFGGLLLPATITIESMGMGKTVLTIENVQTRVPTSPADFLLDPAGP